MARTAGSKNTKPRTVDPLLAALIARLPPPDTVWPVAARDAWIDMMEKAFDVVYGVDEGQSMANGHDKSVERQIWARPEAGVVGKITYAFYIDREGFARADGGERINANQVDGRIYDLRGEGDLGSITWADGSTGVIGKMLDIAAA